MLITPPSEQIGLRVDPRPRARACSGAMYVALRLDMPVKWRTVRAKQLFTINAEKR
jgi:hypothetical protein